MENTTNLILGDCLEKLKDLADNSVDSIVTDPPAGISFMGKGWDGDKGGRDHWITWKCEIAKECLRVLKPGGHALVWALPRTAHWTTTAWENAGFEVRDVIAHLFGSGFPKSHNIGKSVDKLQGNEREDLGESTNNRDRTKHEYNSVGNVGSNARVSKGNSPFEGWGTALKPAREDYILLRKPFKGTVASNVLEWGTGGINIDKSRVEPDIEYLDGKGNDKIFDSSKDIFKINNKLTRAEPNQTGRFPANIIHDGSEEVLAVFPDSKAGKNITEKGTGGIWSKSSGLPCGNQYGDEGSASRFFYCAKPCGTEKNAGLENSNTHPTVKAIKLMSYLCNLITPSKGIILDPFMGSGSTGVSAVTEGFHFIGIELDKDYFEIATARIESVNKPLI